MDSVATHPVLAVDVTIEGQSGMVSSGLTDGIHLSAEGDGTAQIGHPVPMEDFDQPQKRTEPGEQDVGGPGKNFRALLLERVEQQLLQCPWCLQHHSSFARASC